MNDSAPASPSPPSAASTFRDGAYRNVDPMHKPGLGEMVRIWWTFMFDKPAGTVPRQAIPVHTLTTDALLAAPDATLYRLGHSTMLIKLGGAFYLTDPVFSTRASPVGWAGPERFHAPPIGIDALPPIAAVILSHDHYDHLDRAAVLALDARTEHFVAPLGVGERLVKWGIARAKVRQLDWWQETDIDGVRLAATPARHFSGRGLGDRDATLWASWVIMHGDLRLFFSGDSGYFGGFRDIGDRYGPFDLAMVENGAYNKQWPDVHMQPEETLQAFLDLRGKCLMPIHNGTFDLSMHRWQEPLERIAALAERHGVALATPAMGEALDLTRPRAETRWWRGLE
ncbi:hydrolase [Massilia forsythiae]|uniref:Hydrolase n=1 Tax=Massilia forsythiae TaxID=2728020 RepID=A0A7Z2ZUH0_9BURK|nr:MBL fold metallo-hydrolase [Massilia forsythiae]QJE02409.1 hydrolase [Massilia forsythiae]